MNVGNLRDMLEGYDDDAEVLIATQPSWPLATQVARVIADSERDVHDEQSDEFDPETDEQRDRVWLVAGDATYPNPYAPRDVFRM